MTKVAKMESHAGQWTPYGKGLIAQSMLAKGRSFVAAAVLLRQRGGYEYVTLHLLCQGIEVLGKGYLLSVAYDKHHPQLKRYGHNLMKIAELVEGASSIRIFKPAIRAELQTLSGLYAQHLLRYGSGYDVLVDATTIPSKKVLIRVAALLRLQAKHARGI